MNCHEQIYKLEYRIYGIKFLKFWTFTKFVHIGIGTGICIGMGIGSRLQVPTQNPIHGEGKVLVNLWNLAFIKKIWVKINLLLNNRIIEESGMWTGGNLMSSTRSHGGATQNHSIGGNHVWMSVHMES